MLRLAQMVQESLLPPPRAELPGLELAARFLPAANVGGDFFDYFPLDSRHLALYLGDVQGKGLEAALYGLVASGILRGVHKAGAPPSNVLTLINRRLCYRSLPGKFSCLGYAIVDLAECCLIYASAGIPFPLLLRDGGVTSIKLTGTPLGLFDTCQFDQTVVRLRPGDRLLFYSDGLPDSLQFLYPHLGEGNDQLKKLVADHPDLSAAALADKLLARLQPPGTSPRAAKGHNGDRHPPSQLADDATFMVIHLH